MPREPEDKLMDGETVLTEDGEPLPGSVRNSKGAVFHDDADTKHSIKTASSDADTNHSIKAASSDADTTDSIMTASDTAVASTHEFDSTGIGVPDWLKNKGKNIGLLDWIFGLEKHLIPAAERQVTLHSSREKEEIISELKSIASDKSASKYPQVRVKVKGETVEIACKKSWRASVSPHLQVRIHEEPRGSEIRVRISFSKLLSTTVNAPFAALISALISFAISSYLLPHPILLFTSLLCTLPISIVTCIAAVSVANSYSNQDLPVLLNAISEIATSPQGGLAGASIEDSEAASWSDLQKKNPLPEEAIAAAASGVIFLAIAGGLHAAAWNYWVSGEYQKCAELCQPVAAIAESVLGKDDTTVADCKYYLAETHRCLGNTDKALKLYTEAEDPMEKTLGKQNNFYADVLFNLGRCYEEKGEFDKASDKYEAAIKAWKASFGERNMIVAKALDRLAVLRLKQGKLQEAHDAAGEALKIDKGYRRTIGALAISEDLVDLGAIEIRMGSFAKAFQHLKGAIEERKAADKKTELSSVPLYLNLAQAFLHVNDPVQAMDAFQKAQAAIPMAKQISKDAKLSEEDFSTLSKAYALEVQKNRKIYEVPNFDTRATITFKGDGRI